MPCTMILKRGVWEPLAHEQGCIVLHQGLYLFFNNEDVGFVFDSGSRYGFHFRGFLSRETGSYSLGPMQQEKQRRKDYGMHAFMCLLRSF